MAIDRHLKHHDLSNNVHVCGIKVSAVLNAQNDGTKFSCNSQQGKSKLETLTLENYCENSGFLLWFSSYCLACIF